MTALAGTSALVRFVLRRDRLWLPAWVLGIALLVTGSASSVEGLYPTAADLRAARSSVLGNTAIIALKGPAVGLDTLGGQIVFQLGAFTYVVTALMNIFLVLRHTRSDEESGRAELVRSAAVGRDAAITSTLLVALVADVAVGASAAAGVAAIGPPLAGSLAYGVALAAVGLVFAAVTAVTAQVTEHARLAGGLAAIVLGAAFVLRAIGDAGAGRASWFSPIGWGQAVRPFVGERWWVLAIPIVTSVGLLLVAFALADRRDLGAGLVRPRPGSPVGSDRLTTPVGLAARLQRGSLVGWAAAVFLGGVAYGSIAKGIDELVGDNRSLHDIVDQAGGSLTDSFFVTTTLLLAMIGAGFSIQSTMRLRSEETSGRLEPVLATALGRIRWAAGHLTVALGGSALMLVAAGLGTGLAYAVAIGDAGQVPRLLGAALVHLPALWVAVGFTVLLFGMVPRVIALAWAALALCLVVGLFGQLLELPAWLRDISPFEHTPQIPVAGFDVVPLAAMTALAAMLTAAGLAAFRRRDIG
jgi:ABC-2 type transport system permease protein